jgi:hypothetical protein
MAAARLPCQGKSMVQRDEEKQRRLAEALRENLRKRKAQARAQPPAEETAAGEPPPEP